MVFNHTHPLYATILDILFHHMTYPSISLTLYHIEE